MMAGTFPMPRLPTGERMRPRVRSLLALLSVSAVVIASPTFAQNTPQRPEPQPTGSARIFFWDDYSVALNTEAHERLQELELRSDGIAVLALRALRLDPKYCIP